MSMIEAGLFPVLPQFAAPGHNREVTSMSDTVHTGRRSRHSAERGIIESRLMFAACYVAFLLRAVATRLMPWRKPASSGRSGHRESVFREASSDARVLVASSFMGL
jgi:hypothetical protein